MDPLYSQIPTLRVFSTIEDPSNVGNRLVTNGVITGVPPTDVAGVFAISCIIQRDDSAVVYKNAGTVASPSWAVFDTSTGGLPSLTDGDVWVGNGSDVATAVTLSGDVTISNTGVATVDAIDLETATVTGIADTEILIGTGAGTAAFAALSGDVTISNTGVATIGSGVVEKTMLATGIKANFIDMFLDDSYTTVGTAAAEVISVAGVVPTDKVIVSLYDAGTNAVSVVSAVAGTDDITVTFSADPGNDAIIAYVVKRATV